MLTREPVGGQATGRPGAIVLGVPPKVVEPTIEVSGDGKPVPKAG